MMKVVLILTNLLAISSQAVAEDNNYVPLYNGKKII